VTQPVIHHVTHEITVSAPAEVVYELIADVTRWPCFFAPTVQAERAERNGSEELIRIWALANGEVRTWTSRRWLNRERLRIEFAQQQPKPPVASMSGTWVLEPLSATETQVVLGHTFSVTADADSDLSWLNQAVDTNSTSELAALKATAELHAQLPDLLFSFEDSVSVDGDAEDVYQFLHRAQDWPQRLPHVARLELTEDAPNVQTMEMDTKASDGSVHTTRSVRVCFPSESIIYKQVQPPRLMRAHTGRWLIVPDGPGVKVSSEHTVMVRPDAIAGVLGADATVPDAKNLIRTALSANSTTTMEHAKAYAEERRRG
jgi:aromatase